MLDAFGAKITFGSTYSVSIANVGSGPEFVSICQGIASKTTPAGKVTLDITEMISVIKGVRTVTIPKKKTQASYWPGMLYFVCP